MVPSESHRFYIGAIEYTLDPLSLTAKRANQSHGVSVRKNAAHDYGYVTGIHSIDLIVTDACNCRCSYCYVDGDGMTKPSGMSLRVAIDSIDWLISNSSKHKHLLVCFFGGEPLLRVNLIAEIIEYAERRGLESEKRFQFIIVTNGTILNEQIIDMLKRFDIELQISLDGIGLEHDRNRIFANGKGTYSTIIKSIKKLRRAGIQFSIRATVDDNRNPARVKNELSELGAGRIKLYWSTPKSGSMLSDRRPVELYQRMTIAERDYFLDAVASRDHQRVSRLAAVSDLPGLFARLHYAEPKFSYCNAGHGYLAVSPTGEIYVCHRFTGKSNYRLGSIYQSSLSDFDDREMQVMRQDQCSNCFARFLCGGGCFSDNLAMTGDTGIPANDFCDLKRTQVESVAYLSAEFGEEDLLFLEECRILKKRSLVEMIF